MSAANIKQVFVTGATGYTGRALINVLLQRGHRVRALARAASAKRVPQGAEVVIGDALDSESFAAKIESGDTLVHLIGTPHPSPAKASEFVRVDLASIHAAVQAAARARCAHLVYVSVAQPAPVMHAYLEVRKQGEEAIARAGLTATVLRPWYVTGPGHRWPLLLIPFYALGKKVPAFRESCMRLDLIPLDAFVRAMVWSVENPPALQQQVRVMDVPAMKVLHAVNVARVPSPHPRG